MTKLSAGIIIIVALVACISCESNKPEEIKALTNIEEVPLLIVYNLESTILDSGIIKYKIITPELYDYGKKDPPYLDFPKGGQIIMYDKAGKVDAQIKSQYAKFLKNEKLWELRNNVEAINQKGEVLNTELLYLDETHDRIYTDLFVKITTPTEILTGTGFESNMNLTKYSFRKPQWIFEIEE
jgi:LPS export ABC transporter protein LptC